MTIVSRRHFVTALPFLGTGCWLMHGTTDFLAAPARETGIVFQNVRVFDAESGKLSAPRSALINTAGFAMSGPANSLGEAFATVAGGGRTLLPQLIEAHAKAMRKGPPAGFFLMSEWTYISVTASHGKASDLGIVIMPRIWPALAFPELNNSLAALAVDRPSLRPRRLLLSHRGYRVSICDPRGALQLASPRGLHHSAPTWGNCSSVDTLTAYAVKQEIVRATRPPDLEGLGGINV